MVSPTMAMCGRHGDESDDVHDEGEPAARNRITMRMMRAGYMAWRRGVDELRYPGRKWDDVLTATKFMVTPQT